MDVLKREKIDLIHCKADKMIADYFSKPINGGLLKKLTGCIMGTTIILTEERVGNNIEQESLSASEQWLKITVTKQPAQL